jgi:hypothetical protein
VGFRNSVSLFGCIRAPARGATAVTSPGSQHQAGPEAVTRMILVLHATTSTAAIGGTTEMNDIVTGNESSTPPHAANEGRGATGTSLALPAQHGGSERWKESLCRSDKLLADGKPKVSRLGSKHNGPLGPSSALETTNRHRPKVPNRSRGRRQSPGCAWERHPARQRGDEICAAGKEPGRLGAAAPRPRPAPTTAGVRAYSGFDENLACNESARGEIRSSPDQYERSWQKQTTRTSNS